MIPCALVALINIGFKLDVRKKGAWLSMAVGILGAGGQLALFQALKYGPGYLVIPMISVAPIVTIVVYTSLALTEKALVLTPSLPSYSHAVIKWDFTRRPI